MHCLIYYFHLIGPFFIVQLCLQVSDLDYTQSVMLRVPEVRIPKTTIMPPKHTPETELKGRAS